MPGTGAWERPASAGILKDVIYRCFKVLPPDPHRFDSDHDGRGGRPGLGGAQRHVSDSPFRTADVPHHGLSRGNRATLGTHRTRRARWPRRAALARRDDPAHAATRLFAGIDLAILLIIASFVFFVAWIGVVDVCLSVLP